ncbi:MAG TPA: hypothetical protein VFP10_01040 [Candidatus Eisenbacteria bacterium]|nr:hypothetical protein [Candidatus Eisenbacteria bacterium]
MRRPIRWILCLAACIGYGCSENPAETPDHRILSTRAATFAPVETLNVPTDGSIVTSALTLESGTVYQIRASGTFHIGERGDSTADAEYADFSNVPSSVIDNCPDSTLAIDMGIGINDAVNDSLKVPRWGDFRSDHVYTIEFTGAGAPVTFTLHDCNYADNSGSLTVEILAQTVIPIDVDIKPGSDRNPINLGSNGVIPVAIMGSADFDVRDVDPVSLAFGILGAPMAHGAGELEDMNEDGYPDLLLHFRTQSIGLEDGDTEICLSGTNWEGVGLLGCDSIVIVPPEHAKD